MTTVSCVIPTHRRAHFLSEALRSVAAQTVPLAEIQVVSDVHDPDTRDVCEQFSRLGLPLSYIVSPAGVGGASSSRNLGSAAATGDYIAYLDDDDLWAADYVENALHAIQRSGADVVVTWLEEFSVERRQPGPRIKRGLRAQDVASINPGATGSNMLVARKAVELVEGFDPELKVKNDTDFFYRLLRAGVTYDVVERELVFQRKHQSGQLTAKTETRAAGTEAYLRKHLPALTAADVRFLRQHIHRIRAHSARTALGRTRHAAALALLHEPKAIVNRLIRPPKTTYIAVGAFAEEPATDASARNGSPAHRGVSDK